MATSPEKRPDIEAALRQPIDNHGSRVLAALDSLHDMNPNARIDTDTLVRHVLLKKVGGGELDYPELARRHIEEVDEVVAERNGTL